MNFILGYLEKQTMEGVSKDMKKAKKADKPHKLMWSARKEKQKAAKRHASNYKAGHIHIDEYHLNRTGIRGRKRWILWCIVLVLLIIATANLLLNCALIGLLHMSHNGLPYLVLQNNRVLFPQSVEIGKAEMAEAISGYHNRSIGLESATKLEMEAGTKSFDETFNKYQFYSRMHMNTSTISIEPFRQFQLKDSTTNDIMTLNTTMAWIRPPLYTNNLDTNKLLTEFISTDKVIVNCSSKIGCIMHAKEKVSINSDKVVISADHGDIQVALRNNDFVMNQATQNGAISLPNLPLYQHGGKSTGNRLCICDNGRIFRTLSDTCHVSDTPCRNR